MDGKVGRGAVVTHECSPPRPDIARYAHVIELARYVVGVDCGAPQLGQTVGLPTMALPQFQQGLLLPNSS